MFKVYNFFFFWLSHTACGILVPRPRIEPVPSAVEACSPNHCTAREFLKWTNWKALVCIHLWNNHHNQDSKHIHHSNFPSALCNSSLQFHYLPPDNHWVAFCCFTFIELYIISAQLFWDLFISLYQWFIPFYFWVVFHCIDVSQFVYVLPVSAHLGGFQFLAITNEAARLLECLHVSLCINIYFYFSWGN